MIDKENIFDIKDNEIDIKGIERQIKENIIDRKRSGIYTNDMEDLIKKPLQIPHDVIPDIDYLTSNWKINSEYKISSHRPIIGRLLIWGRKLINGEVRRYVDILMGKQSEFNMHTGSSYNEFNKKINVLEDKIDDFSTKIKEIKDNMPKEKDLIMGSDAINYFLFEDKYRGNIDEIKKKQSIYIEYFRNCKNVLDIGCGRGEFLTLLKDNNINGKGIDIDENMILYCKRNNLDVEQIDAASFLQSLKNKSLDGIFSSQVVEHWKANELINIIKLCYDKMQYDTYVIIETINPLCFSTYATFYKDLTHVRLVHPDTLKFILESAGFRNIEVKLLNNCSDGQKLDKLKNNDYNEDNKKNLDIINKNIDTLNSILFGYQDYAIIAKK